MMFDAFSMDWSLLRLSAMSYSIVCCILSYEVRPESPLPENKIPKNPKHLMFTIVALSVILESNSSFWLWLLASRAEDFRLSDIARAQTLTYF